MVLTELTKELLVKMERNQTMVVTEQMELTELMTKTSMVLAEHMEMTELMTKMMAKTEHIKTTEQIKTTELMTVLPVKMVNDGFDG